MNFSLHHSVRCWLLVLMVSVGWAEWQPVSAAVYKFRIRPQWSEDHSYFWYRNDLANRRREFVLVDLLQGTRKPAFDHKRLAEGLKQAGVFTPPAERLPIDKLRWDRQRNAMIFHAFGRELQCDLNTYEVSDYRPPVVAPRPHPSPQVPASRVKNLPQRPYFARRDLSPDGKWRAVIIEHDLYVQSVDGDVQVRLTKDGSAENSYHAPYWAANTRNLLAFRVQPARIGEVHLVESSPRGGGRAKLQTRKYALPGDKFTTYELNWFDMFERKQLKPDVGLIDFRSPRLHWSVDGRYARYQKIDRGHQRFRVIEIDTHTGSTRNIIDEQSKTFIWTEHYQNIGIGTITWLKNNRELIHLSEQSGWRHLHLVDIATGSSKPITQGEFVVRRVDWIDQEKRQIWFRASGRNKDQNPYLIHHYRVNFDGTGLIALTAGDGSHELQFSPDRRFLIDTYSRIDHPPVHEVRRTADGAFVCHLETADISELNESGWEAPEVFSAKGRDGETEIWGIICRPTDFDPRKKYPVIEYIYAGPHDSHVPTRFIPSRLFRSFTDLGFVVVQIDGMGTANRSKAFHDVCWQNLKDAGFPDRIPWHKAVAEQYPWYDTSRVGIYGNSAGGQNAMGALLFHPEFYKVAVATCGCHDNRMDKASWNEQWMGYPVGPHYAASSNVDNAHRLQGKLMLAVGELDKNVPPESTMRVVDALIKADKDFDLLVIPGGGHGLNRYGDRRRREFFQRHLLGKEPAD